MTEALWLLLLISAVGAACFYAGWRAAAAYLPAARAVSDVAAAAIQQSNAFGSTLDNNAGELASLRSAIDQNTKALEERNRAVEDALHALFQGLERSGLARAPRATPRQVGEAPPEA